MRTPYLIGVFVSVPSCAIVHLTKTHIYQCDFLPRYIVTTQTFNKNLLFSRSSESVSSVFFELLRLMEMDCITQELKKKIHCYTTFQKHDQVTYFANENLNFSKLV